MHVQVQVRVQVTMYLVTSVPAQHITYVVMLDCVPVADAGVPLVCSCCPPLHLGDGAGMRAGELSNTNIQVLPHVNVQV